MNDEELIETFETARVIGLNGTPGEACEGENQRYLVINQTSSGLAEMEFFSERPITSLVGGEPDNWPSKYQVWMLVEEDGNPIEFKG